MVECVTSTSQEGDDKAAQQAAIDHEVAESAASRQSQATLSDWRHTADVHDRRARKRDQRAAERDRQADEREQQAAKRDQRADERDRQADERDQQADERDHDMAEREGLADQHEIDTEIILSVGLRDLSTADVDAPSANDDARLGDKKRC